MLGKIAEKMSKPAEEYLESYLKVKKWGASLLQGEKYGCTSWVLLNNCFAYSLTIVV
jgi:hypothetical protein